jgi:predicted metal-dependent peptidase
MAAPRKRLIAPKGDLRDRKALLEHDPAPPEVVEAAKALKNKTLMHFSLGHSVIASWLYTKCHHHIPTTAIPTAAVVLLADGSAMLLYNPHFFVSLGEEGVRFVLFHEARHLIMAHLFTDPALRADKRMTLAQEACINYVTGKRLGMDMPTAEVEVIDAKGNVTKERRPTGIDPRELYKEYKANLEKAGLVPVGFEKFIETDMGCYSELCRMSQDPDENAKGHGQCIHQDGDPTGAGGGDSEGVPMDDETVDRIAQEVLHAVMKDAVSGSTKAQEELLELGERTDGADERITKLWGKLGLHRLRGETQQVGKVNWWQNWLNDTVASKLREGEKLMWPKKRGAVDMVLGNDTMLVRRGDEEVKRVLIAYDTSGSMGQEVLDYLMQLVGHTDGVETEWVSFDGVVMPFVPGERVYGGGGTDFGNVMEYAEGRLDVDGKRMEYHPDAVIMVTDGYAAPIRPEQPDKWIWLITEGGTTDWLEAYGEMDYHRIDTGDGL